MLALVSQPKQILGVDGETVVEVMYHLSAEKYEDARLGWMCSF